MTGRAGTTPSPRSYSRELYDLKVRAADRTTLIDTTSSHLFWSIALAHSREADDAVNAIEAAVRVIVDLLVRDQYVTVEKVTRGRRLTADQISSAISAYGRTLVSLGDDWWSTVEITPIDVGERPAFHVAAPLWTVEEGRSDLTLEMVLRESPLKIYDSEVLNIRVL